MDREHGPRLVSFKSWPVIFEKEKSGKKPNTLRKHDENDPRFIALKKWHDTGYYGRIRIENSKTGEDFYRLIQDITYVFDNWVIISWEHSDTSIPPAPKEAGILEGGFMKINGYSPDFLKKIERYIKMGRTDFKISDFFNIPESYIKQIRVVVNAHLFGKI